MQNPDPQFSPKQVANSLRVSESSVKRWCDRGVIPTIRTVGGHRRITRSGLEQFLAKTQRTLLDPEAIGMPAKSVVGSVRKASTAAQLEDDQPDQGQFRSALIAGDELQCSNIIENRLRQGWSITEVAEDLIVRAMHGIGYAWDCGELDVYQERRGCDICIRLIQQLNQKVDDIPEDAPVAVGGAPENDPYQLPSQLVGLTLRDAGINAVSLGNNLPIDSLIQAVEDYQPQLVWLSVSAISNTSQFIADQNRLADSLGEHVPLLIGGQALTDEIRPKLRYTAHCDTLRQLAELASMISPQS